jgi:putative membrane protein
MFRFVGKTLINAVAIWVAAWIVHGITLTLGLITFVINALMLWLTSWASGKLSLDFHVNGFVPALLGSLIISLVAWALHMVFPDKD